MLIMAAELLVALLRTALFLYGQGISKVNTVFSASELAVIAPPWAFAISDAI